MPTSPQGGPVLIVVHTYGVDVAKERYSQLPRTHAVSDKSISKLSEETLIAAHHGAAVALLLALKDGDVRDVRVSLSKMSRLMAELMQRHVERTGRTVCMTVEESDPSTALDTMQERVSDDSNGEEEEAKCRLPAESADEGACDVGDGNGH